MAMLLAPLAFAVAWIYVTVTNARALREWRKSQEHWAERARILYPIRVAARLNIWMIPINCVLIAYVFWTENEAMLAAVFVLALMGATLATYRFDKELFPRFTFRGWLWSVMISLTFRLGFLGGFIMVMVFMPGVFGWGTAVAGVVLVIYLVAQHFGLWIWLLQKARVLVPAPRRLVEVARKVSEQTQIRFRTVWLLETPVGYAAALPMTGDMIFSEGVLFTLPDEGIAAICAHELAHLNESRGTLTLRVLTSMWVLPMAFIWPVENTFGLNGVLVLLLIVLLLIIAARKIARKMEERADAVGKNYEPEPGVYAAALEQLYEMNQMPAVMPQKRNIHPHLYDRILAAGITPDYPRPEAPEKMDGHGTLMSTCLGLLVVFSVVKYMHH